MLQSFQKFFYGHFICRSALYTIGGSGMLQKNKKIFCALRNIFVILNVYRSENKLIHRGGIMTLTIPISRFRRLLFAVLQTIAPARASAAAHAQLSQLYDRWGTAVFRAAYAYLHNKSDAEDVLQDTFLQYMRTSPELESPAHEKAWLLRVAINLSKNKLNSA